MSKNIDKIRYLTSIAIFSAVIIILQYLGSFIRIFEASVSLVLIPIVVGAALLGPMAGAILGFVFGVVVIITAPEFMAISVVGTIVTCILKGVLAGYLSGLVYKIFEPDSQFMAVGAAAIVAPIVNTLVFLLVGCCLFFFKEIEAWGNAAGATSTFEYMMFTLAGVNFIAELLINLILSPVIIRIIEIGKKLFKRK